MRPDTLEIDASTKMPVAIVLHTEANNMDEVVVKGVRQLFKNEDDVITANVANTLLAKAGSLDKHTDGVNDFHETGSNSSKNKPTTWLTDFFYSLSAGKTNIDITNDLLVGRQRVGTDYVEDDDAAVSTNNKSN